MVTDCGDMVYLAAGKGCEDLAQQMNRSAHNNFGGCVSGSGGSAPDWQSGGSNSWKIR